jgi:hypothetical protein
MGFSPLHYEILHLLPLVATTFFLPSHATSSLCPVAHGSHSQCRLPPMAAPCASLARRAGSTTLPSRPPPLAWRPSLLPSMDAPWLLHCSLPLPHGEFPPASSHGAATSMMELGHPFTSGRAPCTAFYSPIGSVPPFLHLQQQGPHGHGYSSRCPAHLECGHGQPPLSLGWRRATSGLSSRR